MNGPTGSLDAERLPRQATVLDLILHAAQRFEQHGLAYGHGMDNAQDEAAALVFHALDLEHDDAARAYAQRPADEDIARTLELIDARIGQRVPAAYLMGRMWFGGLEFEVDPRVIVPRSPIAELIDAGFAPWAAAGRVHRILDIGTGSGCIAIACACAFPAAHVDAIDVSPEALQLAQRNVVRHGVEGRVRLLQGDVFEPVPGERYDIIVSNPPYVSDAEMDELPEEYRHEPSLALRAGTDGLDIVRRILAAAAGHLTDGGILVVEVGNSDERLERAYPRVPFTWLEFMHGGGGVFLLGRDELERHAAELAAELR